MAFRQIPALVGVSLLVLVANILASVLYMVLYGHVINPGHEEQFYRDHIQVAGPYCSIVAGIPLMFFAGWWVAGWEKTRNGVSAALTVWLSYTTIDLLILLVAGMTLQIGILFTISFATKLAACYFGARLRDKQSERSGCSSR